jgi:hypothetical protein
LTKKDLKVLHGYTVQSITIDGKEQEVLVLQTPIFFKALKFTAKMHELYFCAIKHPEMFSTAEHVLSRICSRIMQLFK